MFNKILFIGFYLTIVSKSIVQGQTQFVSNKQQFSQDEKQLIINIKNILDSHLVEGTKWGMPFHFYRPGLKKYGPYQWLWDSCFHMISWSRLNVTNSILELRTMLQKKDKKNSRIPQMIFWGKQPPKDKLLNNLLLSDPTETDITQMPMIPFALKRIYEETKNKTLLKEFVYKVAEYHEWWAQQRQPDHDGLVVILHPWESGLDASPMYDEALLVTNPVPPLLEISPKFEELLISYKYDYKWNQRKIVSKKKHSVSKQFFNYFVVKQVGVNAVYTAGWKILSQLSLELNNTNTSNYCLSQYNRFKKGLISLYDQKQQRYVSKYLDKDQFKPARANTVQSLFPILIKQIPQEHKNNILLALRDVNQLLSQPKQYSSQYPIPTVSQSDPAYNPIFTIDLMWRGPSWAAPNYFILQGLRNLNQHALYKEIGQKWVNQAISQGVWEMWNPKNGTGYGVEGLGMSTSVIDTIYRLKEIK